MTGESLGDLEDVRTLLIRLLPKCEEAALFRRQEKIALGTNRISMVRTLHNNNEYVVKSVYHFFRSVCTSPSFILYDWPIRRPLRRHRDLGFPRMQHEHNGPLNQAKLTIKARVPVTRSRE